MAIIGDAVKADKTITIEDFIALRNSDEITYYNYSIVEYLNGYDMFVTNLLYDYEEELKSMAVTVELSDRERLKYRYKPNVLAYDLYGSVEAKFILMILNEVLDPKEFDFAKIKAVKPNALQLFLGRIEAVNSDYMTLNRSKLKADFKANEGNTIWK